MATARVGHEDLDGGYFFFGIEACGGDWAVRVGGSEGRCGGEREEPEDDGGERHDHSVLYDRG